MTPRLATGTDRELLASLHAAAFPPAEAWSEDVFGLQLALPNVIGLLQDQQGMVLLRVAANEAEVLTIAVAPGTRRRGVATSLLTEALSKLAAIKIDVVFLEVSVTNTVALALYRRFGFVHVGRRLRYYLDGSDALVLRLDLKPSSVVR